jgi:amino acid permease
MVGAGVLGLPYTFVYLGWACGMAVMLLSLIISWYTFYGEALQPALERFDR